MDDRTAKEKLRLHLNRSPHEDLIVVATADLREVLRELGELRQIVQQQAKGLRDAGNAALAENRNLGRVFANAAAASALRENARLRAALERIAEGGPPAEYERAAREALADA